VQSLEHQALAYFRSKPADEGYDFFNPSRCALSQFGRDLGFPHLICPDSLEGTVSNRMALALADSPYTFGALADRLEKALSA